MTGLIYEQTNFIFPGDCEYQIRLRNLPTISLNNMIPENRPAVVNTDGELSTTTNLTVNNLTVNGTFSNPSDLKLKSNIKSIDNGLKTIAKLSPLKYTKKDVINIEEMGFIADDILNNIPGLHLLLNEFVLNGENIKCINYIGLIPILGKAVQELYEMVKKSKKILVVVVIKRASFDAPDDIFFLKKKVIFLL